MLMTGNLNKHRLLLILRGNVIFNPNFNVLDIDTVWGCVVMVMMLMDGKNMSVM